MTLHDKQDQARLRAAYRFCRQVARREAKNFYYAFRVMPEPKRNAICAVYAFMRHADDLADEERLSIEQRREQLDAWVAAWRHTRGLPPGQVSDPVFLALAATQQRFGIPDQLLEELVQGTAMDLEQSAPGAGVDLGDGLQGYRTFADLYRYCYLVASVVGLVCIRIFGYSDPKAELLAERTGIAFQLTNILRDVREDAERGRIYLPQDLLAEFQVRNEDVLELAHGRALAPNERAMLSALSVQAAEYYEAGRKLLPLVDRDSRPALWVLIAIYRRLLKKIEAREGDVFSQRVRVSTWRKVAILLQGVSKVVWWRKERLDES